jgi:hypothetical protein
MVLVVAVAAFVERPTLWLTDGGIISRTLWLTEVVAIGVGAEKGGIRAGKGWSWVGFGFRLDVAPTIKGERERTDSDRQMDGETKKKRTYRWAKNKLQIRRRIRGQTWQSAGQSGLVGC